MRGSTAKNVLMSSLCLCAVAVTANDDATMHEVAVKAERPAGAPEYGDVCFRYGWIREGGSASVDEAKKAMRAFHATRVDWFYPGSHTADANGSYVTPAAKAFIDWCHANGMKIVGAINTLTANIDWKLKPWNNSKTRYVGDPANQAFVDETVKRGTDQIDAGVDALLCDDFFKYNEAEMRAFSDKVITAIKAHKPGFMVAGNSGHFLGADYVKTYAFDFHYSDSNFLKEKPSPGGWCKAARDHRNVKSCFLTHPNRHMPNEMRRELIALGYAVGAHVITPWDEFISGKDRLFADPADFADLYGFARALGQHGYLNGYEDAAVGGYDLKEDRYGAVTPITVTGGSGKLSVFGRAKPGQADAPVVLHLVESGPPQAGTLKIRISLLGAGNVTCTLFEPKPYNEAEHEAAANSGNYTSLSRASQLKATANGDVLTVDVPPVKPWSTLIITPVGRRVPNGAKIKVE